MRQMNQRIYFALKLVFFSLSVVSGICLIQWILFGILYGVDGKWMVSYNNFNEMYLEFALLVCVFVFIVLFGLIDLIKYLNDRL